MCEIMSRILSTTLATATSTEWHLYVGYTRPLRFRPSPKMHLYWIIIPEHSPYSLRLQKLLVLWPEDVITSIAIAALATVHMCFLPSAFGYMITTSRRQLVFGRYAWNEVRGLSSSLAAISQSCRCIQRPSFDVGTTKTFWKYIRRGLRFCCTTPFSDLTASPCGIQCLTEDFCWELWRPWPRNPRMLFVSGISVAYVI